MIAKIAGVALLVSAVLGFTITTTLAAGFGLMFALKVFGAVMGMACLVAGGMYLLIFR